MIGDPISGGCQCGAVRFRMGRLANASICHCRMCQKAFGGFYAPLVTAYDLEWTRGAPTYFQSSNKVRRGFCAACGTPLSYDYGAEPEIAIGALDRPQLAAPTVQVNPADMLPFVSTLASLPFRHIEADGVEAHFMASLHSYQHPDEDTKIWPPQSIPDL